MIMWAFVKRFLAKSKLLNQTLGDVVFETAEIKGASSHSFFQWRIKKTVEGGQYFVGLAMRRCLCGPRWIADQLHEL